VRRLELEAQLDSSTANASDQTQLLRAQLAERNAQIAERDGEIASLRSIKDGQISTLRNIVGSRDENLGTLEADISQQAQRLSLLETDVADRAQKIAGLQADVADRDAIIEALQGDVSNRDATIAELTGTAGKQSEEAEGLSAQIASLTAAGSEKEAEIGVLRETVNGLESTVSDRDATIAALRAQTPATASAALGADQCAGQASAALEGSRINFVTASAEIESQSVPLLERLTGIALACVGENGVSVEIGGHTDAQGSEANNLALSEARAQAVVDFMTRRGVPTDGLKAVGFGESAPVASNDTAEGRAENRRISFDWQTR